MGSSPVVRLRIKEVAQQKGISQSKLARLSDLSIWTVRAVWKTPSSNIGLQTLAKLAAALDSSVCKLIEELQEEHADQGVGKHQ